MVVLDSAGAGGCQTTLEMGGSLLLSDDAGAGGWVVSVNDAAGGVGVVVSVVAGVGLVDDDGVGNGVIGVVDQAAGMVGDVVWLGVVVVIC